MILRTPTMLPAGSRRYCRPRSHRRSSKLNTAEIRYRFQTEALDHWLCTPLHCTRALSSTNAVLPALAPARLHLPIGPDTCAICRCSCRQHRRVVPRAASDTRPFRGLAALSTSLDTEFRRQCVHRSSRRAMDSTDATVGHSRNHSPPDCLDSAVGAVQIAVDQPTHQSPVRPAAACWLDRSRRSHRFRLDPSSTASQAAAVLSPRRCVVHRQHG